MEEGDEMVATGEDDDKVAAKLDIYWVEEFMDQDGNPLDQDGNNTTATATGNNTADDNSMNNRPQKKQRV